MLEALIRHDRVHTGVFYFDADEMLKVIPSAANSSFFAAMPLGRPLGRQLADLAEDLARLSVAHRT